MNSEMRLSGADSAGAQGDGAGSSEAFAAAAPAAASANNRARLMTPMVKSPAKVRKPTRFKAEADEQTRKEERDRRIAEFATEKLPRSLHVSFEGPKPLSGSSARRLSASSPNTRLAPIPEDETSPRPIPRESGGRLGPAQSEEASSKGSSE